jgi:hypothetical protein
MIESKVKENNLWTAFYFTSSVWLYIDGSDLRIDKKSRLIGKSLIEIDLRKKLALLW